MEKKVHEFLKFYIGGRWIDPVVHEVLDVENPATEAVCGRIAVGSAADVDRAVAAALRAFASWSLTNRQERLSLLKRIAEEYQKRESDFAEMLTEEMGAPAWLAAGAHVWLGESQLAATIRVLNNFVFEEDIGSTRIVKEPIGVCGLITPWNWPLNQIAVKVFPAIAAGCTVILKPSEVAPFSSQIFAEVMDAAGVPPGVFNLVQGTGNGVGVALSAHPDIDMVSFTGSTRAGIEVARNAAPTLKRVCQELGGKSANIVLDDSSFARNVGAGVKSMMGNSGQTCSAPSRMLVPHARLNEALTVAREAAENVTIGHPSGNFTMGPVASRAQFDKIQSLIQKGIEEGATLVSGGPGRPEGLSTGYYVRPTVFANVSNEMAIGREEIFGPVLTIMSYESIDDAIATANNTEYGLAGYVAGDDLVKARAIASRLRAGSIVINDGIDFMAPFGGYKRSGNGREWGEYGFQEYLETKSVVNYSHKAV